MVLGYEVTKQRCGTFTVDYAMRSHATDAEACIVARAVAKAVTAWPEEICRF